MSNLIIKTIIIFMMLTGFASASVWIGDKEVGLAAYQSNGDVAGNYIIRPHGMDTTEPYYETESQNSMWQGFRYNPEGYQINPKTGHITRIRLLKTG